MAVKLDVGHAIVLGPGEGEATTDRPERTTRIKAGLDAITVTEMRHESGRKGPDVHIHRRHTDAFYVLEGVVTFALGPDEETVEVPAGSFVAAPPGVVHTFRNDSSARSRLLNIHAPSERFHDHLREVRDGIKSDWFDQADPPADGGRALADATVLEPGAGELIRVANSSVVLKGTGENTDGHLFLAEVTLGPGFPSPRPHVPRTLHDLVYVLEGTLTVRHEEGETAASPGTFACFPPSAVHTFSNADGSEPVRFLNFHFPAGWENLMRELGDAFSGDEPPSPEEVRRITSRHDFETA
jgi:uncharacterized cupin superfamily protein